jgi:hypothetical protein
MRNESTAQPFEAELDRYVESVVLSQAAALGDAAALAAWMEQEAAGWRKTIAISRCWMRNERLKARLTPFWSEYFQRTEAADRVSQNYMLARDLAIADILEQLAREVREARAPKTRH